MNADGSASLEVISLAVAVVVGAVGMVLVPGCQQVVDLGGREIEDGHSARAAKHRAEKSLEDDHEKEIRERIAAQSQSEACVEVSVLVYQARHVDEGDDGKTTAEKSPHYLLCGGCVGVVWM